MNTRVGKISGMKRLVIAAAVFFVLSFCRCTRDKSINESTPLSGSAYFPMTTGQSWSYHVNYNERINTPPVRNVWYTGAEHWTLTQKNDADSSLVFDVDFAGMKISIDTNGVADSINDQLLSAKVSVHFSNGRLLDDDDTEAEVFFDNWLRSVDFQIAFPDSSATSIQISSDGFSNANWSYTLERDVGMRSGEWTADYIFGSFHLEYLLFEKD